MVNVRLHAGRRDGSGSVPTDGTGTPNGGANPNHAHQPQANPAQDCGDGQRLNLLLSYAGWHAEPWVDLIPPLLGPMGVVSHRAASGAEASRVIRSTPIHIAVVDLGLPLETSAAPPSTDIPADGGLRLLDMLRRLDANPPTVIVKRMRTHRDEAREIAAALKAGAFAVVDRPSTPGDLEIMLDVLRRCLCRFYKGRWPGTS